MKQLVNSLAKYTGLTAEQLEEAFEAIQDEIYNDVDELIEQYFMYLDWERDEDGTMILTDDFKEKFLHDLFTQYRLERK